MEGWIKIWRKVKDSELFLQDPTAWRVFEYLLMSVDYKTGKYTSGRNRDALYLCMKPSTFYKALKRLEKKWLSVNIASNNKFSTISIINWSKYQDDGNSSSNNKVTTKEQQSNTYKEVKNKELKKYITAKNLENLKNKYNLEFEEELQQWEDHHISKGTKIKDYDASFRTWCRNAKLYGRELKDKKIEIIRRQK